MLGGFGHGISSFGHGISSSVGVDWAPPETGRFQLRLSWLDGLALAVALLIGLGFVHPMFLTSPTLRAGAETSMTLLAVAAAVLTRQQFLATRRLRELILLSSLLTLALVELLADTVPAAIAARPASAWLVALPFGQLFVGLGLALAALTPSDSVVAGRARPLAITVSLSVAAFGLAAGAGLLLRGRLLIGASGAAYHSALIHPLGLAALLAAAALFMVAAIQFARRDRLEANSTLSLLAGAAILLAGARVYYLALPRGSSGIVSVQEALRLIGFAMIFAAVLRRELQMRRDIARAAAVAERRRVAQDLHDGLAQDLALIAAHSERIAAQMGREHPVVVAARRALALSRDTISELSDPRSTSPREALEAIAQEQSERFGIRILVDVHPNVGLAHDARDQVARIVREAIANAARHGRAENIVVSLKPVTLGVSLRVSDDGGGIYGASGSTPEGFGIRSMRERAAGLGGFLTLRPRHRGGTELEVILP